MIDPENPPKIAAAVELGETDRSAIDAARATLISAQENFDRTWKQIREARGLSGDFYYDPIAGRVLIPDAEA